MTISTTGSLIRSSPLGAFTALGRIGSTNAFRDLSELARRPGLHVNRTVADWLGAAMPVLEGLVESPLAGSFSNVRDGQSGLLRVSHEDVVWLAPQGKVTGENRRPKTEKPKSRADHEGLTEGKLPDPASGPQAYGIFGAFSECKDIVWRIGSADVSVPGSKQLDRCVDVERRYAPEETASVGASDQPAARKLENPKSDGHLSFVLLVDSSPETPRNSAPIGLVAPVIQDLDGGLDHAEFLSGSVGGQVVEDLSDVQPNSSVVQVSQLEISRSLPDTEMIQRCVKSPLWNSIKFSDRLNGVSFDGVGNSLQINGDAGVVPKVRLAGISRDRESVTRTNAEAILSHEVERTEQRSSRSWPSSRERASGWSTEVGTIEVRTGDPTGLCVEDTASAGRADNIQNNHRPTPLPKPLVASTMPIPQDSARIGADSQIAIRLDSGKDTPSVEVRIRERGGEVQIAVRSSDRALATELRQDLGDLVRRLEPIVESKPIHLELNRVDLNRPAYHSSSSQSPNQGAFSPNDSQQRSRQPPPEYKPARSQMTDEDLHELRAIFSEIGNQGDSK